MSTLVAGNYKGRVKDYCLQKSKNGVLSVAVQFQLSEHENTVLWNGYFTEKTTENTKKALKALNISTNKIADLYSGRASGLLDVDKEVELDIIIEEHEGKKYAKVNWVNEVGGGGGFRNKLDRNEAAAEFAGVEIDPVAAEIPF